MLVQLRAAGAAAGVAITEITISLPRAGAWVADLALTSSDPPTGRVEIDLADTLTLAGTVSQAEEIGGVVRARVVAGGDGLRKKVKPKHYTSPTVGIVLRDLLADVGETLASGIAPALLNAQLEHWTTMTMPAGQAIRCLFPDQGEVSWRHLPDGTLWVGAETWADSGVTEYTDTSASPENATFEVTLLAPELLPGRSLDGRKVDAVELRANGSGVAATVWALP